jgi:hypothetical protein
MSTNRGGKTLRTIGIVFMALTAGFTLLGGMGTSCVAFNPTGFSESMARLAPFQWLYILFVLIGIALGVLGIRATVELIKGKANSYRDSMIVLIAGVAVGVVHMFVSRALRGKSMPVDQVVYMTVLTLILFLIFRIPSIWEKVDFTRGSVRSNGPAGGAAAIILGLVTMSMQYLMGPSHTWDGVNYAAAFNSTLIAAGVFGLILGSALILRPVFKRKEPPISEGSCESEFIQELSC